MTLPSSPNSISFSQIEAEFGQSTNRKLGDYRKTTTLGGKIWPIDDNVPTSVAIGSSQISFGDLHGKQHNIVALMSGGTAYRLIASSPSSFTSTAYRGTDASVRRESKNIVYVNRVIGSEKHQERKKSALRTGKSIDWYGSSGVNGGKVLIRISPNGALYGAGGDGGTGRTEGQDGDVGQSGTSALGIELFVESVTVENGGIIRAGGGGGGGGGGAREDSATSGRRASGGGGGGGAGLPSGEGGISDNPSGPGDGRGQSGNDGSLNSAGNGGEGGNNEDEARGGGGGGGGSFADNESGLGGEGGDNSNDTDGSNGNDTNGTGGNGGAGKVTGGDSGGESDGGNGGAAGYAITRDLGIPAPTILGETSEVIGQQGAFGSN